MDSNSDIYEGFLNPVYDEIKWEISNNKTFAKHVTNELDHEIWTVMWEQSQLNIADLMSREMRRKHWRNEV